MPQTLRKLRGDARSQSTAITDHGGGAMLLTVKLQNPEVGRAAFQEMALYQSPKPDPRSNNPESVTEQLPTLGVGTIT